MTSDEPNWLDETPVGREVAIVMPRVLGDLYAWWREVQKMRRLEDFKLSDMDTATDDVLRMLSMSAAGLNEVQVVSTMLVAALVRRGRDLRMSWAEMGRALDMTPQGVYKLYQRISMATPDGLQPEPPEDAQRSVEGFGHVWGAPEPE